MEYSKATIDYTGNVEPVCRDPFVGREASVHMPRQFLKGGISSVKQGSWDSVTRIFCKKYFIYDSKLLIITTFLTYEHILTIKLFLNDQISS